MEILKETKHCKLILMTYEEKENIHMGILDQSKGYKPKNNDAKKELIGDAVAQVKTIKRYVKENETEERIMIEFSVIHPIEDSKGRETTVEFGDKITKYYRENGGKKGSIQAFFDDMFTAEIGIDQNSYEAMDLSFMEAINTLVYLRCYVSEFEGRDGETVRYQNVIIKSKKLITDELSQPKLPF